MCFWRNFGHVSNCSFLTCNYKDLNKFTFTARAPHTVTVSNSPYTYGNVNVNFTAIDFAIVPLCIRKFLIGAVICNMMPTQVNKERLQCSFEAVRCVGTTPDSLASMAILDWSTTISNNRCHGR